MNPFKLRRASRRTNEVGLASQKIFYRSVYDLSLKSWSLRTGILAGLVATLLVCAGQSMAQEQTRVVEGTIFNATTGSTAPAGLSVTLHQIATTGPIDLQTESDDKGTFFFGGISYDPTMVYGVSVRYQGTIYGTDLNLSAGSPDPLQITIYDSSSDDAIVSVGSASLLLAAVDKVSQTVAALEIVDLVNSSDHAYVPGPQPMQLLRFGLPDGSTALQVTTALIDADFAQVDRGFALFASVPPGRHQLTFSYRFPYLDNSLELEKSYRYGAESIRILAPLEVLAIAIPTLGEPQTITIGERQFQLIEANGLVRGERLSIHLDSLPRANLADRARRHLDDIRFEYVAPTALATLMVALLAYSVVLKGRDKGM